MQGLKQIQIAVEVASLVSMEKPVAVTLIASLDVVLKTFVQRTRATIV
jgi:hypothetical protein